MENTGGYSASYHKPVLWREIAENFITSIDGIYVDGTLGGGGHSELLLDNLGKDALVIGLDRDPDALAFAGERLKKYKNFIAVKSTFSSIPEVLEKMGLEKVDGILLDLGVSSHQIDTSERGFSFSAEGPLDMRMSREDDLTAEEILNNYSVEELADIFYAFGEEKKSRRIAAAISDYRKESPLKTTAELKNIIGKFYPPNKAVKAYARVFQSLRIFINRELDELEKTLGAGFSLLKKGGRFAVIAYHSLEDRIVKKQFRYWEKECVCDSSVPVCVCDKKREAKIIRPFPFKASEEEVRENNRSRSARLRICEKVV